MKKAIAGILSFAMIMTLNASPATEEVLAADVFTEEEIFVEDVFSDGEAAFSDGGDSFTDTQDTSFEKTLEVTEGEDITEKLNGALLEMKDKATDQQMCKVIIPPGNYGISKTICTYSNIHIYARGAVIRKISPDRHLMLRLGNTDMSAGGYDGYRNIIIEGGTWDTNYESVPDKEEMGGIVAFRLGHATNVEIKDATFLNNFKSHLLELGGIKNARVTGCTFRGYWEPFTEGGQEAIQIDACRDFILPDYLPYDGAVCENIRIVGNTFENVFAGVGSHSMVFDRPYKNIVIRGNTFRNITKRAVWCLNYVDSVVEDNVMYNVGTGIYVRSVYKKNTHLPDGGKPTNAGNQYSSNIKVSNNRIVLNEPKIIGGSLWKSCGIVIIGEKAAAEPNRVPDGLYPISGITVRKNKITGLGNGIRVTLADKCTIIDNSIELTPIEQFGNGGMIIGAANSCTIKGNTIKGAKGNAIYLFKGPKEYARPGKSNIVTRNTIVNCADDGIVAGTLSDYTEIEKNRLQNLGGNGIVTYGNKKVSVSGNIVNGCGKNGILMSSGKSTEIRENKISGCVEDGIKTEGKSSSLIVNENRISENNGSGMYLTGAKEAFVTENEIVSNYTDGISIVNSSNAVISKNNIMKNKGYALIGTDSSIKTYSDNVLEGNGYTDTIYAVNTSLPYSLKNKKAGIDKKFELMKK